MKINIFSRHEATSICKDAWEDLLKTSIYPNPFFGPEWLLKALNLFDKESSVFIVTIYNDKKLICLFPIILKKQVKIIPYFDVWQHNHCFDIHPLINENIDFKSIVLEICKKLNCIYGRIHLHKSSLIENINILQGKQVNYKRAFILNTNNLKNISWQGKFHRENRRLINKSKKDLNIKFYKYSNLNDGLNDYSSLEVSGWKGQKNGAINSLESTKDFYNQIISTDWGHKSISIYGLKSHNSLIASSIRINCQNMLYEIKTTFHEGYKKYAPGRVLELLLIDEMSTLENFQADSCTHHNNTLINKLWPDTLDLYSSIIYSNAFFGITFNILHKFKSIIKE